MVAGVILGLLAIVPRRAVMRPSRRVMLIGAAAAAFILVLIGSAGRGRGDLVAMRQNVLPAVERLLRADVLIKPSPVEWIDIRRKISSERGLYTYAYGEMRDLKVQIAVRWFNQHPAPEAAAGRGSGPTASSYSCPCPRISTPPRHAKRYSRPGCSS
jgi:hypothetical protein